MTKTKQLTENDLKRQKLGDYGERAVVFLLKKRGHKVEYSKTNFDNQKDLVMNDTLHIEVKTQVPFFKKNAFSINESQYKKCTNAAAVCFVQTPNGDYPDEYDGCVYAYDQKSIMDNLMEPEQVWDAETKTKRLSYPVKRQPDKIIGNVKDMSEDDFERMKDLTTSLYGKKKDDPSKPKEYKEVAF